MNFGQWEASVGTHLKSSGKKYPIHKIDFRQRQKAFQDGESPVLFAKRDDHILIDAPSPPSPDMPPPFNGPFPQTKAVLSDPKYQLNTGQGVLCPVCGSSFIKAISKPGSGLGFLGSFGWVMAGALADQVVKSVQRQPYCCGYCDSMFYDGATVTAAEKINHEIN